MLADYAQLETAWINAGGSRAMAPLMAAIALAESGENVNGVWLSNTDATNPNDNNGTQTSWGAWQISNGTHLPPSGDWNTLDGNATLAVQKYQDQGLSAWGTYTSGKYKSFLRGGVPASAQTTGFSVPGLPGIGEIWNFGQSLVGGGGGISGLFTILGDLANPDFWKRIGKGALGVALAGTGAFLLFHETDAYQEVKQGAKKAGETAAEVAVAAPK